MSEYPGVTFHPWVGNRYCDPDNRFGVRLLVLAESHYGKLAEAGQSNTTRDVVRRWGQLLDHDSPISFFTKVSKLLRRDPWDLTQQEREAIWENVAFYNFIQTSVGDGPRIGPTASQWCAAQGPLDTVLSKLKPDAVLVLGKRLAEEIQALSKDAEQRTITYGASNSVPAAVVTHPAGPMQYKKSMCILCDLLCRAKSSRE